jgi:SAM-dependent MidA family methyltransferase
MEDGFPCLREGWCYEVNLRMLDVLADLDEHLEKGAVVTIDYGFDRAEYDALERSEGTLLCYFRHQVRVDPYQRVGEQDITAHVNFEVMKRFGEARNWKNLPLRTQREFLADWGLEEKLLEEESRGLLATDRLEDRLAMKTLLIPGGISDTLKVQIQEVRMPEQGGHQDA